MAAEREIENIVKPVSLAVKSDGVYLYVNRIGGRSVTRVDVMRIVEENKVKDIDFAAIGTIFANNDTAFEVLISRNTDVLVQPETAKVTVAQNGLSASVVFIPPLNCDTRLTYDKFKSILAEAKVVYGIDDIRLETLFDNRKYNIPYEAAVGTPPVDGENGYIVYHFDTNPKTYRPRERGDGTVDYKQVNLIDVVREGDLLIEGIPPVEGVDGTSVTGKALPHKPGKPHPVLLRSKNTIISDDGHQLRAGVSGQLVYKNNRVEIFPVLQISGDVNHTTGNIDFIGSVVVAGNVLTGFTVKAEGSIEIHGIVEGAYLHAGESISLMSGIQGMDLGEVTAKGNITAKFIDQCKVWADGDIITDFIVYSDVKCCGMIELMGKRGLLLGGRATVKDKVTANVIGAELSASTELELGFLPDEYERYKDLQKELDLARFEYEKITQMEQAAEKRSQKSTAGAESALDKQISQSSFSKAYYENKILELEQEIAYITPDCGGDETCIIANKMIYMGVRVTIGSAQTTIFENVSAAKVYSENGRIVIGGIV